MSGQYQIDTVMKSEVDRLQVLLNALQNAFDASFRLCEKHDDWQLSEDLCRDESLAAYSISEEQIASLSEAHFETERPRVTEIADGLNLIVVPIDRDSRVPTVAVAMLAGNPRLLQTLATSTLLNFKQQHQIDEQLIQLDCYIKQVSSDLEELSYLRSLANYVEYCDVTSDIENLATAVLPSLCEVIGADSIVLVSSGSHSRNGQRGQFSMSSPMFRAGQTDYSDRVCRRIVTSFGHQARSLPVVQNNLSQHPEFSTPFVPNILLLDQRGLLF